MIEYVIHKMNIRDLKCISFEFIPSHRQLSGFLFCDSKLMFGEDYRKFEKIMKNKNYSFSGDAYSVEISCDAVQIMCDIDCEGDENDLFSSDIISRDNFVWVMNEWIRENRKLKSTDSKEESVHSSKVLRQQNKLLSKICRLFGKR